jgi:hypothetical protein
MNEIKYNVLKGVLAIQYLSLVLTALRGEEGNFP